MKPYLCFLCFSFLLIGSCKQKHNGELLDLRKDRELLGRYFSAATVGVVSANETFTYLLHEPVEKVLSDDELSKCITLSPQVKGKVTLTHSMKLMFDPEEPLQPGKEYSITIDLSVLDKNRYSGPLAYKIKTIPQGIDTRQTGMLLNSDGSWSAIYSIKLADVADQEKLKACFSASGADIQLVKVSDWEYQLIATYAKGKNISTLGYDGKSIGADTKGEVSTNAPTGAQTNTLVPVFQYHNVRDNTYTIYFSELLKSDVDLSGMVTVNQVSVPTKTELNRLTVYLATVPSATAFTADLQPGIPASSGRTTQSALTWTFDAAGDAPAAEFVGEGHYFSSKGDFQIPIKTRSLRAVRLMVIEIPQENVVQYLSWQSLSNNDFYTLRMFGSPIYDEIIRLQPGPTDDAGWVVHGIDLSQKLNRNPGSLYHISMDFGPAETNLGCTKDLEGFDFEDRLPDNEFFKVRDAYYYDYYYPQTEFDWRDSGNPCKIAYYVVRQPARRMFLCTDYSIIAKKAGNAYRFAVADLHNLSPVSGVNVELYSLQGQPLLTCATDGNGFAVAGGLTGDASVAKCTKGNQITYIALQPEESNSLTEFVTDGERSEQDLDWFVYTERAVWRPGDSIRLYVMSGHHQELPPSGLPITLSFYSPDKLLLSRQVLNYEPTHPLYGFTLYTAENAKTGVYQCVIKAGPATLVKNIRIETITPNSSEVILQFDNTSDKTILSDKISGSLTARYLTGSVIPGAFVKVAARIREKPVPFVDYSGYTFDVLDKTRPDPSLLLFEGATRTDGTSQLDSSVSLKNWNTPVSLSLEILTTLPGGGISQEGELLSVSPLDRYLGARMKKGSGWDGNFLLNETIEVDLVSVLRSGMLSAESTSVRYSIRRHTESWWVDKYRLASDGNFVASQYWKYIQEGTTLFKGKGKIRLAAGMLEKGAYKLTMVDTKSGHETQVYFTVYNGEGNIPGSQPYIVEFTTEKESYRAGEDIIVRLPPIEGARALLSVERGNDILHQEWVSLTSDISTVNVHSHPSWAPNIYLHLTVLQPYSQVNNDLPLRMYGIRHVSMEKIEENIQPVASLPAQIESGMTVQCVVQEKNGLPMAYSLALVDEGILGLTGFVTPNPVRHFFGRYPLLVKTWDIYKYLLSSFRGAIAGIISVGGDAALHPDALPDMNTFTPVSIHLGPFFLKKGEKRTHSLKIPNYTGKARLMIVACNQGNYGHLEKHVAVKKDLMLKAQMPRSLNVTDKIELPVSLFKELKSINTAIVKSTITSGYVAGTTGQQTVSFGKASQATAFFSVNVLDRPGQPVFSFDASANGKTMKESVPVSIRYPNEMQSTTKTYVVEPGQKTDLTSSLKGYPETYTSTLTGGGLLLPDVVRYGHELVEYPYGCLEQITSAAMAQLFLEKAIRLSPQEQELRKKHLAAAEGKLARLQTYSGAFSYWGNQDYHAWSDIYAGLLLVEMKQQGLLQGNDMLNKWLANQVSMADNWSINKSLTPEAAEAEFLLQAFRLYTLARASRASGSVVNRFLLSVASSQPLTYWFMAGASHKMGFTEVGDLLCAKAEKTMQGYRPSISYTTFGSEARDLACMVVVISEIPKKTKEATKYYEAMVQKLNISNWPTTQEKGFAVMAVASYMGQSETGGGAVSFDVREAGQPVRKFGLPAFSTEQLVLTAGKKVTVRNLGKSRLYLTHTERAIPRELSVPAASSGLSIKAEYTNVTARKQGLQDVKLGDEISLKVTVTNTSLTDGSSLALTVRPPSGLMLINQRITDTESPSGIPEGVFQDFREDVVHSFFSAGKGMSKTFTFILRAAFAGDFHCPGPVCRNMYQESMFARVANSRVQIKKVK